MLTFDFVCFRMTGPWEVLKRLGLEDELLKYTDARPSEKPGTYGVSEYTTTVLRRSSPLLQIPQERLPRGHGLLHTRDKRSVFFLILLAYMVYVSGINPDINCSYFIPLNPTGPLILMPRPDFQNALLRKLPRSYRVHCSKRLRSYSQRPGGPVTLLFEDGSQASCDILVGADGIKSAVRRSFLHEKALWAQGEGKWSEAADIMTMIEPSWSGTVAYRAVIPGDQLRARDPNHSIFTHPTQVNPCAPVRFLTLADPDNQYIGRAGVCFVPINSCLPLC